MNTKRTVISSTVVIVFIAGVIAVAAAGRKDTASNPGTVSADLGQQAAMATASTTPAHPYKDGVYSVTASYDSPGGMDNLGVSLTLKNGIVTDANVTNMANDRTSSRYQDKFISGYKQYVIGKSIDSIHLDAVSGSSLTPIGFNSALDQIKAKAQI